MSRLIISCEKPEIIKNLQAQSFGIIKSESLEILPEFERNHADMQCLRINNTLFVLKDCKRLQNALSEQACEVITTRKSIEGKYPGNVLLNAVFFNNRLYSKLSAVDEAVLTYCERNNIETVNVSQGYAKCSTAILADRFITADRGIFESMTGRGERGLLISSGSIDLSGVDYGFIGGCAFEFNNKVYFTGDISRHPDYKRIKSFLNDKEIICLSEKTLYDIGGVVAV